MDASDPSGGLSSARLGALLLAAAAGGALATWAALRIPRGGAASSAGRRGCEAEKDGLVGKGERGPSAAPGPNGRGGDDAPTVREPASSRLRRRPTGGADALGSRMSSIDLGHAGPWSGYGTDGEVDARRADGEVGSGRPTLLSSAAGSSAAPTRSASPSRPRRGSSASTDPACVPFWWPSPSPPREDPLDPRPRERYLSWDDYFMSIAFLSAQRSKDPNKQVGAVVVDRKHVIAGIGYNGFPRGCSDHALPWRKIEPTDGGDDLGTKYLYVVHAETNAILNANRAGLEGSSIYVTLFPCNECAKLLIQVGIREVVYHEGKGEGGRRGGLVPRVDSAGGGGQGGYDGTETSVFGLRDDDEEAGAGGSGAGEDDGEGRRNAGQTSSADFARAGRVPSADDEGRRLEAERAGAALGIAGSISASDGQQTATAARPVASPSSFATSAGSPDRRQSPFAEPSGGSRVADAADDGAPSPLSTSTSSSSSSTSDEDESARVAGGEPAARDASGSSFAAARDASGSSFAATRDAQPPPSSAALPAPSSRPQSSSGPRRRVSLHASSNPFSADFDRAASTASLQPSGTPIPSRVTSYAALGTAPLLGPSHPSSSSPTIPDLDGTGDEEVEGNACPSESTPTASSPRPIPSKSAPVAPRGAGTASPLQSPSRPDAPRARFSPSGSLYASPSVFLAPERRATAELRGEGGSAQGRGTRGEPDESATGAASPRPAPDSARCDPAPSSPFLARVPSSPMLTHRTLRAAKKAKAARDAQYRASRRMLAMAGVAVRQHTFEHEA